MLAPPLPLAVLPLALLASAVQAIHPSQMPLTMVTEMNSVRSVSQLMTFLNDSSLKREGGIERRAVLTPEPAWCMPERQTVKLATGDDPSLFYIPSCTRVERCGGCCTKDDLLSCQPTQTEIINYEVLVTQYTGGNQLSIVRKEIIPVEKHLKCKCDCIVKATDCNRLQTYQQKNCQCVCINRDEQKKCNDDSTGKKFWNRHTCTCDCHSTTECTSGYTFNKHSCSCEAEQRPRIKFSGVYGVDSKADGRREEYSFNAGKR